MATEWLGLLGGALTCIAYGLAGLVLLLRGLPTWPNRFFALAIAVTSLWAGALFVYQTGFAQQIFPDIVGVCRDAAWLALLIVFLRQDAQETKLWRRLAYVAVFGVVIELAFVASNARVDTGFGVRLSPPLAGLSVSALGMVLIENLLRNLSAARRWSLNLMAVGLAALFLFNMLILVPEVLAGATSQGLIQAQPLAYLVVLPLFLVTAIRNDSLRLHIHSSRTITFQTATVVFVGLMLQGAAVAAYYVKTFGGTPAIVLGIVLGFTAFLGFFAAMSSRSIRSRLKGFISENFYSYKYDYRLEWMKFVQTLSADQHSAAPARVLRTLTDLLDSPGGILWVRRDGWRQFLPLASWSLPGQFGPIDDADSLLVAFDAQTQFLELDQEAAGAESWRKRFPSAWLSIPIRFQNQLIAFALLQKPRAPRKLDWEDRNLLRVIVSELAAHLVHEHVAHTLSESQQLVEFNKRLTFALHDLKNSGGQLKLLAHNVEKFGHRAEFRVDMLSTLNHVADKLQNLIDKLKAPDQGSPAKPELPGTVNLVELIAKVAHRPYKRNILFPVPNTAAPIGIHLADPKAFESALEHVIANAAEASLEGASVEVRAQQADGHVSVEVIDTGRGMSEEFIAQHLFRPFYTTKAGGLGVGAYQARALLREIGGDLQVKSTLGKGTTVTLILRATEQLGAA